MLFFELPPAANHGLATPRPEAARIFGQDTCCYAPGVPLPAAALAFEDSRSLRLVTHLRGVQRGSCSFDVPASKIPTSSTIDYRLVRFNLNTRSTA